MLDIFSGLRLVVKRRTINIDNAIFRCHWFFTSTLLVSFSLIITARQYVGQPIECHSVDKIPDSLLNSYCWVQSTFTVPQACNNQHYGVEVPYPCIDNTRGRDIKIFAYYQWVGIVLFIQGLMFHLPYYLWKLWENGLIKAITGGLRVAVLNEHERAKKKDIVVEYISNHLGSHKRYALKYFLCEFICLINLLGQLWATNKFFDGQFLRYGIEVLEFSSLSLSGQNNYYNQQQAIVSPSHSKQIGLVKANSNATNEKQATFQQTGTSPNQFSNNPRQRQDFSPLTRPNKQQVDPMTYIFPRMTKCTYFDFGPSGDVQKHDALCLLPLNIINEKIYIALWFWFILLAILTLLVIIYRLLAIISESVRCKGLISRCKLSCEEEIRLICRYCDVGDWFLFYMVAENLDPLIMRELVSSIAIKIRSQQTLKEDKLEGAHEEVEGSDKRRLVDEELSICRAANAINFFPVYATEKPVSLSRRGSLVDQIPLVNKVRKRFYNKRLWSAELGPIEQRQHLFGVASCESPPINGVASEQNQVATLSCSDIRVNPLVAESQPNEGATARTSATLQFASAPPANQMPLDSISPGALNRAAMRRRGSLSREASSTSSSGISSIGSFIMDMSTISCSSSYLDGRSAAKARPSNGGQSNNMKHHD